MSAAGRLMQDCMTQDQDTQQSPIFLVDLGLAFSIVMLHFQATTVFVLCLVGLGLVEGWVVQKFDASRGIPNSRCALGASSSSSSTTSSTSSSRREFVQDQTAKASAVAVGLITTQNPSLAVAQSKSGVGSSSSSPICVIGANGKTGIQCVQGCLERNLPVRATSRSGVYTGPILSEISSSNREMLLSQMPCNVIDKSQIEEAIRGSRAVIFAASASKAGGTAAQVDNQGLVNVAEACLTARIPQLVIVSSGSVSKPDSIIYKFLNLAGGIMDAKIQGEDTVRDLYRRRASSSCSYTIIRPGGLTEDVARGVSALELNQGDTKSGRISRADVANLCIESILYPQYTAFSTYECYDADTGKSLDAVGFSNLLGQKAEVNSLVTGRECRGNTYEAIFQQLEPDFTYK